MQTVCEYCKSILVRTDVDLQKVGQVADLPPEQLSHPDRYRGEYNHKAFTAIGRIIYEYEPGQLERVALDDERRHERLAF